MVVSPVSSSMIEAADDSLMMADGSTTSGSATTRSTTSERETASAVAMPQLYEVLTLLVDLLRQITDQAKQGTTQQQAKTSSSMTPVTSGGAAQQALANASATEAAASQQSTGRSESRQQAINTEFMQQLMQAFKNALQGKPQGSASGDPTKTRTDNEPMRAMPRAMANQSALGTRAPRSISSGETLTSARAALPPITIRGQSQAAQDVVVDTEPASSSSQTAGRSSSSSSSGDVIVETQRVPALTSGATATKVSNPRLSQDSTETLSKDYNKEPDKTRIYQNQDKDQVWSDVPRYPVGPRSPKDLPDLQKARSQEGIQSAKIDGRGHLKGFDGEDFNLPTEKVVGKDRHLTLINDLNKEGSIVLNAKVETEKSGRQDVTRMRAINLGLGDDLAIRWNTESGDEGLVRPQYSYNGKDFQAMEEGLSYSSNDGGKVRYVVNQPGTVGQLQIDAKEYELSFNQQKGQRHLSMDEAKATQDNDGYALGVLGVTSAPGEQFKDRSDAQIGRYASRHSTVENPFGAILKDHSRDQGLGRSGDRFAGVDTSDDTDRRRYQDVYSERFYKSLPDVSED